MGSATEGGYEIKDSGERKKFESGMVRDTATDKTDYELIFNGPMADRWAEHLTKGAKKYPDVSIGVPNWTLAAGMDERIRFRKSAVRHFRDWLRGKTDEDHAAAVFFNINGFEYVKSKDIKPPSESPAPPRGMWPIPPSVKLVNQPCPDCGKLVADGVRCSIVRPCLDHP